MSIKKCLKKIIYSHKFLHNCYDFLKRCFHNKADVRNKGYGIIKKDIVGTGNRIIVGKETYLNSTKIYIRGNNNTIEFGENCVVGKDCSFWMEGNNISIYIGDNTTFTLLVHFCAQEDGTSIVVGKDCMFSNNIVVRTSDSHPIYDINTNLRLNEAKDVYIGNHIWIAPNVRIMKGVTINDNSIIGSDTIVTKDIPADSLAVGHPAKVVKENIRWSREALF